MDLVLALFKAGTGRGVFITFVSIAEGPHCVLGRTEPIYNSFWQFQCHKRLERGSVARSEVQAQSTGLRLVRTNNTC